MNPLKLRLYERRDTNILRLCMQRDKEQQDKKAQDLEKKPQPLITLSQRIEFTAKDHIEWFLKKSADEQPKRELDIQHMELDDVVTIHGDKWLEKASLHMDKYIGLHSAPSLNISVSHHLLQDYASKSKSFSGDMSGVIGEGLFIIVLTKIFQIPSYQFTHMAVSQKRGIWPDFGILAQNTKLARKFTQPLRHSILPAEVKSTTSPTLTTLTKSLMKAVSQIHNFWNKLSAEDDSSHSNDLSTEKRSLQQRGPSLIFLTMRNHEKRCYDAMLIYLE